MSLRKGHLRRQASVDYPRYPPANSTTQQPLPEVLAILPSDYDSEAQDYTVEYPASLPPVNRTREELNLAVAQKHNPEITSILSVASHATVYDWADAPTPGWQKSGVEGALFICKLTPGQFNEERFHVLVLNRTGLENFGAELRQSEPEGVEIVQDLIIITRIEAGERKANGIFIFSGGPGTSTEHSRAANGELIRDLALAAQRSRVAAEQHSSEAQDHGANGHASSVAHPYPSQQMPSDGPSPPQPRREPDGRDENILLKMFQQAANKSTTAASPDNRPADEYVYTLRQLPPQPGLSPAPQVAPVPKRKVDLLALFQGSQSDTESGSRASSYPPGNLPQHVHPHHMVPPSTLGQPFEAAPPLMNHASQNNDLLSLFRGAGLA